MNNNKKLARIFLIIPIILIIILMICFAAACVLEQPTDRGDLYTLLACLFIFGAFGFPLPCMGFSIAGLLMAVKASREQVRTGGYIALGIIEILLAFFVGATWIFVIFVGGASV